MALKSAVALACVLMAVCGRAVGSGVEFAYDLAADARVTVVVEDAAGRRVRNLVADAPRRAGRVVESWDGRDDNGRPVPVGAYRWRGISHAGELTANWLGSFYSPGVTPWKQHTRPGGWNLRPSGVGGWLSDHAAPLCLYADATHVYVGCAFAEAGDAIVQCDLDGNKLWGAMWLGLSGAHAMCTEGDALYVASEGGWMGARMAVNRFNVRDYKWIDNPPEVRRRHVLHDSAFVREATSNFCGVAGVFLTTDHIGVVFTNRRRVSYFDRRTALWNHDAPLASIKPLIRRPSTKIVRGIATDAEGNVYRIATNAAEQCVRVYSPQGRLIRTIGRPGGRREGRYDPQAMGRPSDVAVDARGNVWVTENSLLPKRVSVWTRDGRLVREMVGTPFYGGGGSLSADGSFAYYAGMRFRMKDGSGALDAVLFDPKAHPELPQEAPMPSTFREWNGRRLLVSDDGPGRICTFIGEETGDRLTPRVLVGRDPKGGVFLWQDGETTRSDALAYGSEWSMRLGPRLEIVLRTKDRKSLAILMPDDRLRYDLARAEIVPLPSELAGVCSLSMTPDGSAFVINRGGCGNQGSPDNLFGAVSRDGRRVLWTYPNPYPSNTHNSPLPRTGELRHTLGIEGFSAAGPGGLMMLNGNKGTRYLFTLDGLFVQELFGDMRVHPVMQNLPEAVRGMVLSRNSLSDECFYGWFGDVGGKPHLIVGKDSLNVCELRGAGSLARLPGGALTLREEAPPLAQTPRAARGPMRTVKAGGFGLTHSWWKAVEEAMPEKEPVARVAIGWSPHRLTLHFDVEDATPFENLGDAPHTLFHSGDALDFRYAADPLADPARRRPVAGDQRIVIAPLNGRPVVMRYVYVDPSAQEPPTAFVSPAGRLEIARIEEIADAKVEVKRRAGGYSARVDIPWHRLGEAKEGFKGGLRRCDAGVLFGDPSGTRVVRRQYLFDAESQAVSDIPSEARINPSRWGTCEF